VKFVAISDTHAQHQNIILPKGNALIHAGDVSRKGEEHEIINFLNWFSKTDFEFKILIAGNHDFFFERENEIKIKELIPENIIYLNDSPVVVNGIKIWGSPVTPWFYDWAFNRNRGADILKHWNLIPADTDILITHGPVYKIHDKTIYGEEVGCEDLFKKVNEIKPKVHICGHIHEAYGVTENSGIKFINASVLNERYILKNSPVTFEL